MTDAAAPAGSRNRGLPLLFNAVTFLSAFLLFQVQLIIAKYMLPAFGGASAVWTTCILFFQILLLLGYGYTHRVRQMTADRRRNLHTALLLISAALLVVTGIFWKSPIAPNLARLSLDNKPTLSVLLVLFVSVGVPFWLLSTTSPLLQHWFWQVEQRPPYRLYALSNLGSLIGLLSYPFLFEPRLNVLRQGWIWTAGYFAFAAGVIVCGLATRRLAAPEQPAPAPEPPRRKKSAHRNQTVASSGNLVLWILFPALGSALMLATTNYLTQDIASIPLLWVVPLSIYLVSFVITFESDRLYVRGIVYPCLAITMALLYNVLARAGVESVPIEVTVTSVFLLFATVFCHGELARLKPPAESLTRFYLWVAVGGAAGSCFVGFVAPHVFSRVWEFPISLVLVSVLAIVALVRDPTSWAHRAQPWKLALATALLGILPLVAIAQLFTSVKQATGTFDWIVLGIAVAVAIWLFTKRNKTASRTPAMATLFLVPLLLVILLWNLPEYFGSDIVLRARNFYGVLTVAKYSPSEKFGDFYMLYNGPTLHGIQALSADLRSRPTTYYGNYSGVGLAIGFHPRRIHPEAGHADLRAGIVGMGVGTIFDYARAGDYYRAYELNPAVVQLSRGSDPYFTNLRDCAGTCEVATGDGRLLLHQELDAGKPQAFDVLVLDAFSGDSIPVHLLTREAFELYLRHLRDDDSVIAVHVSNRALNLSPIVGRLARELGLVAIEVFSPSRGEVVRQSSWVLVGRKNPALRIPPQALSVDRVTPLTGDGALWTDSFSNVLSVIRR